MQNRDRGTLLATLEPLRELLCEIEQEAPQQLCEKHWTRGCASIVKSNT
jgi:hypothetical protein